MSENKNKRDVKKIEKITKKTSNRGNIKIGEKIKTKDNSKKNIKSNTENKVTKFDEFKLFLVKNKNILLVSILLVIDIILIVCFARDNYANYADVDGKVIFVGETKNLLFGRNYVGLVVTCFIYFYGILVSKFLCKNKFKIKQLILLFIGIFVLNVLLFYMFTNKVY